jgi:anti-sigma regulatory factor (Ser/Thr protein kinase)/CheY-like chemotaxis protein
MTEPRGRVLVVGDPDVLASLRQAPVLSGCSVEGCLGQAVALRRARQVDLDVVVTGRPTTVEEDLAFLEDLRQARPGLREIVLAARATPAEVIAALRARVFALFTEPCDPVELAVMVSSAVEAGAGQEDIQVVSARPDWIRLRVSCRRLTADRLVRFMDELRTDIDDDDRRALLAAFRELLLNAMEHGAAFAPDRVVDVSAVHTQRAIVFHFRDPGAGFHPDALEHAALGNPPDDPLRHMARREAMGLRPGGFGILIARRVADELIYNETGNEVLLVRHLS